MKFVNFLFLKGAGLKYMVKIFIFFFFSFKIILNTLNNVLRKITFIIVVRLCSSFWLILNYIQVLFSIHVSIYMVDIGQVSCCS